MKAKDWKKWAKCAGIRAIKTVAQTAIATIGTVTVLGQIDTKLVISTSMLAGILSLLTSITGLPECNSKTNNALFCILLYQKSPLSRLYLFST